MAARLHGIAAKDPEAIVAAATQAIDGVRSVEVYGSVNDASPRDEIRFDLHLVNGRGATGSLSEHGLAFQLVTIGNVAYVKATPAFWDQFGGAAVAAQLRGRWLRAPADHGAFASFAALTDVHKLIGGLLAGHGALTKGTTEHRRRARGDRRPRREPPGRPCTSPPPAPPTRSASRISRATAAGSTSAASTRRSRCALRPHSVSIFALRG